VSEDTPDRQSGPGELPDRAHFFKYLQRQIDRLGLNGEVLGLVVVRLAGLRRINALYGYPVGDALLESTIGRLRASIRPVDSFHRISSCEFALVLSKLHGGGHAQLAAAKIDRVFQAPQQIGEHLIRAQLSMGIALYPEHGADAQQLVHCAELALARSRGTLEPYQVYSVAATQEIASSWDLLGSLERAIANSELVLEFQPKLDLQSNRPAGLEALVRWKHPVRGWVLPEQFITVAQHGGQINEISWWVLNNALRRCAEWHSNWPELSVSVNLSARTLEHPELVQRIEAALSLWGVSPTDLILEITESAAMLQGGAGFERLARLRAFGVKVSIDDFGTGYSSLAYFRSLPADEVKIDKSFVKNILEHDADASLVLTVVQLAHNFGLSVVAEGIETDAARQRLLEMQCDLGQGYLFARPMVAEQVDPWMRHWAGQLTS